MRNLLLAVLVLTSTSLFAQKKVDEIAKFNVETFDFGKIAARIMNIELRTSSINPYLTSGHIVL